MMKVMRALAVGFLFTSTVVGTAHAVDEPKAAAMKAGDTVHACNCGASCPCGSIQAKPGKCSCGKDLAPAKVTKVEAVSMKRSAAAFRASRAALTLSNGSATPRSASGSAL